MSIRKRLEFHAPFRGMPAGFSLSDVEIRLARPQERPLRDALMDERHYLGFQRLAARGLRCVASFGDRWLGLAAWQNGAFKCAPRDRWTGWRPERQFRRLEMVANNTRFLILSEPGVFPNLASFFLARMTRRLAGDWLAAHGHRVLLAETFCDPEAFAGTMYSAAGWECWAGRRASPAPAGATPTPTAGRRRSSSCRRARRPGAALEPAAAAAGRGAALRSRSGAAGPRDDALPARRADEDPRLPPGAGTQARGGLRARRAHPRRAREHEGLPRRRAVRARAVAGGACRRRRVAEPEDGASRAGLEVHPPQGRAVGRPRGAGGRGRPLVPAPASPRPGARRRRQAHPRRQPQRRRPSRDRGPRRPRDRRALRASDFGDDGGGPAATHDLLERSDVRGRVITLDALTAVRNTAKLITGRCGADYVFSVKGNAPETFGILDGIDWERDATGRFAEDLEKARGRLEQRSISVLTPLKRLINYPGVSQIARITRYREPLKKDGDAGKDCTETVCLITSLDAGAASPEELLKLNRGHWSVENLNHRQRDCVFGEDACLTRTGNGPANRASLNSIALAVVFASRREAESLAETRRRLQLNRSEAIAALTRP